MTMHQYAAIFYASLFLVAMTIRYIRDRKLIKGEIK